MKCHRIFLGVFLFLTSSLKFSLADPPPPLSHFETILNPHTRKPDYYYRRGLRHSNTLPATCIQGEIYAKDDAPSGQRIYYCESTNSWILQGGGGDMCKSVYDTDYDNVVEYADYAYNASYADSAGSAENWAGHSYPYDSNGYLYNDGYGNLSWQSCGSGSQTPWTSNIDAAGYNLTGLGDGTRTLGLCDGTYAINSLGALHFEGTNYETLDWGGQQLTIQYADLVSNGGATFSGLQSGAGAPATINTTGVFYVDTNTGILYVQ